MHIFSKFDDNQTTTALQKMQLKCVLPPMFEECYVLLKFSELPQLLLLWALPLLLPLPVTPSPPSPSAHLLPSQQPVTCIILIRLQHKFLI